MHGETMKLVLHVCLGFIGGYPVFLAVATLLLLTPCIHTKSNTSLHVSITSVMKLVFTKASKNLKVLIVARLYTFPPPHF
jgi:hypothetical protein